MATKEEIQKTAEDYYKTSEKDAREKAKHELKLVNSLIKYFKVEAEKYEYEETADAFFDALLKTFENYDVTKGSLIVDYINLIFKRNNAKYYKDRNNGGIVKLPKKAMKNWEYLRTQIRTFGRNPNNWNDVLEVGIEFGWSKDEIEKAFNARKIGVMSEEVTKDNCDEENTYNRIDSKEHIERDNLEFENEVFYDVNQVDVFEKMDDFFKIRIKRKNSNEQLLSAVLTHFCYEKLAELPAEKIEKLSFVNKKIFELCKLSDVEKKELTQELGVTQGAYTKQYKRFFEDFKNYLNGE